ncbi:ferritin-like domain-containing protein [Bacillus sp. AK031]
MADESVVKTLNEFLKGQYMGIHAYEEFIEKIEDPSLRDTFQEIQEDHKQHALKVSERIRALRGIPVVDEGAMGKVQGYLGKFMIPDNDEDLLESALKGESHYGVEMSEEIVKGDLDFESKEIIEEILDKDREHVRLLEELSGQQFH